ncbi:MAG TPA: heavy metal-associated domain-containing protein, partial [Burkholderiaceae bacterium]|nr:heavy metal-associated domain-containing protein [Burkholderiaceae bacterium]
MNVSESMLAVDGMHCAACAPAIEAALRGVPGVVAAEVNGATQRARVRWTPGGTPVAELVRAVQALGYRAWPAQLGPARVA